jgi:hypothetical protein
VFVWRGSQERVSPIIARCRHRAVWVGGIGTLTKQADETGLSLNWIGETGWIQPEFIGTPGTPRSPLRGASVRGFLGQRQHSCVGVLPATVG